MKLTFAPMEGITGYVYRNAFMKHYSGIDQFYTPFISPSSAKGFKGKEKRDVSPQNNRIDKVVVQVLTNSSADFVRTAIFLYEAGYREVNLNLGCPSGTVVAKGKGAGFLQFPDKLDSFFEKTFEGIQGCPGLSISVKTRIGLEFPEEFEDLLKVYNNYSFSRIIIHPRVQKQMYKGSPDLEVFRYGLENSKNKIVYNGDITSVKDFEEITENFPHLEEVMIGRGLLANPELAENMVSGQSAPINRRRLLEFHNDLISGYRLEMNCQRDVLFRMKELWSYLSRSFPEEPDLLKKINRMNDLDDYLLAVRHLLS